MIIRHFEFISQSVSDVTLVPNIHRFGLAVSRDGQQLVASRVESSTSDLMILKTKR